MENRIEKRGKMVVMRLYRMEWIKVWGSQSRDKRTCPSNVIAVTEQSSNTMQGTDIEMAITIVVVVVISVVATLMIAMTFNDSSDL